MPDIEDLDDLLVPHRTVLVTGTIDEDFIERVQPILLTYAFQSADLTTILFDSTGGSVREGLRLYDYIRAMPGPTRGVVIGRCRSIAMVVLQACTERTATAHSAFHFHEVHCSLHDFARSRVSEVAYLLRENLDLQHQIEEILLNRSGMTLRQLRAHMREGEKHEVELTAAQALKIGLIDRIVIQPLAPVPD